MAKPDLKYDDAYLTTRIDAALEERAVAYIDTLDPLGSFSDLWRERLTVLRAYVLVCLEHQANPDDLYAAKLKNYRAEFDATLSQARASVPDTQGTAFVFSIPLERG